MNMNIYRISQDVNNEYETFDSAIVVAPDEEYARNMYPGCGRPVNWENAGREVSRSWAERPEDVKVEYIGIADVTFDTPSVLCASFNPGCDL